MSAVEGCVDAPAGASRPWARGTSAVLAALAVLVIARMAFHALFLPAYEGPDEPHHLGRIVAFAEGPFLAALAGVPLDGSIARAVELRPCGPGRRPCPAFGTAPGAFNLLRPLPKQAAPAAAPNPENHQPPLYYLVAGLLLRVLTRLDPTGWLGTPDVRLLWGRLLSVGLVALALVLPLRVLFRTRSSSVAAAGLLLLLLPGASEALARCSNDAAVFCWSAFLLLAMDRRAPLWRICVLLACGPLIKLTALPIAIYAVASLWRRTHRSGALLGAASACLVFLVQASRGWLWGGTYEFNRPLSGIHESLPRAAQGLSRSLYTFIKTIFWLGGWSFFRAPVALVIAWFLLILGFLAAVRLRPVASRAPHAAGAAAAVLGCVVFFIGNRRFYGEWGGVGGWYVWDWAPWILLAFDDLGSLSALARRILLPATALFAAVANAVYFQMAIRLYG